MIFRLDSDVGRIHDLLDELAIAKDKSFTSKAASKSFAFNIGRPFESLGRRVRLSCMT